MYAYEVLPGKLWGRGRTNHLPWRQKMSFAADHNLLAVVQLAPRQDADWDRVTGVTNVVLPMADGKKVPELTNHIYHLSMMLPHGGILVMCNAGRNRSGLVLAMLLMATGLSAEEAITQVRAARPNAIANPYFEAYLRQLA